MPLEPTGFQKALSASAFKPQERDKVQPPEAWRVGWGKGVGISPTPRRKEWGGVPAPLLPLPGAGLLGRPPSFPLSAQVHKGAGLPRGPLHRVFPGSPLRLATPISAAYPRGPRGLSSVASPGPSRPSPPPTPFGHSAPVPASVDPARSLPTSAASCPPHLSRLPRPPVTLLGHHPRPPAPTGPQ